MVSSLEHLPTPMASGTWYPEPPVFTNIGGEPTEH